MSKELIGVSSNPSLMYPLVPIEFEFQHLTAAHHLWQWVQEENYQNEGATKGRCGMVYGSGVIMSFVGWSLGYDI